MREWMVLLEVAVDAAHGENAGREVNELRRALDLGRHGQAFIFADRYALQMTTFEADPIDALLNMVARWRNACQGIELPTGTLVRTEVFTVEDLERELAMADSEVARPDPLQREFPSDTDDRAGDELLRRAFSDPLTGLLGRHAFTHRLATELEGAGGQPRPAVVCLRLEGREPAVDVSGWAAGNPVLMAVLQRLASMIRPGDVLARLAADRYGVLLRATPEDMVLPVATRLLEAARLPINIAGDDYTITASAGVAVAQSIDDAQTTLTNAEGALIAASMAGGPVIPVADLTHPARSSEHFSTATLQDPLAHLVLLQEAAVASNEADTLHGAAQVVMRQMCTHIGCAMGHLWISPAGAPEATTSMSVWHMGTTGHPTVQAAGALTGPLVGLIGDVLTAGRVAWICDLVDNQVLDLPQEEGLRGMKSAFAFPVVVGMEVVAVMAFFSETHIQRAGSLDDLLGTIGSQLGRVVERQRAASARQRSDEQLRAARTRLRDAEGMARLGSWHFDLRSGEGSQSEGMHNLYGVDPDEPLDLAALFAAVDARDRDRAEAAYSRMIETGHRTTEEIRIMGPDGEVRWHRAEGSAIRDEDGVVVAIEGTVQDIHDAKLAQETLANRERQLTQATRTAGLGWWEREISTNRLTWSDDLCRMWGWAPGTEITFDTFLTTLHPKDRVKLLEEEARAQDTGEPFSLDCTIIAADGRERWMRAGVDVLRHDDGTPLSFFGTVQDITAQKEAEQQLRRRRRSTSGSSRRRMRAS